MANACGWLSKKPEALSQIRSHRTWAGDLRRKALVPVREPVPVADSGDGAGDGAGAGARVGAGAGAGAALVMELVLALVRVPVLVRCW